MGNIRQLQEVKNRFSELVRQAHKDGPQIVTKSGKKSVAIISIEDYKELNKPKDNLSSFLKTIHFTVQILILSEIKISQGI